MLLPAPQKLVVWVNDRKMALVNGAERHLEDGHDFASLLQHARQADQTHPAKPPGQWGGFPGLH